MVGSPTDQPPHQMPEGIQSQNQPLFFGSTYEFGIDGKRRVQFPSKWRRMLDAEKPSVVLVAWRCGLGRPPCLQGLLPRQLMEMQRHLSQLPFNDPATQSVLRNLGADMELLELDKGNRICLPEGLARKASLDDKALLVGTVNTFQIWNPDSYREIHRDDQRVFEMGMEQVKIYVS